MKYEKYKDSGIEWIGNIPEYWEAIKLGRLFDYIRTGLNPRDNFVLGQGDNYYVTIKNIKNGQVILDELCDYINNDALQIIQNRSKLKKGDILFPSIGVDNLSFLIREYPQNWNINESIFAITPNNKLIESEYLLWLLNSTVVSEQLDAFSTGSTFRSIKQNQLNKLVVAIPNGINEQEKIATYLDKKTEKIDSIIKSLEDQKEKLEQYKRELIAEVITKGLNNNIPMKDSGVDWIGQVPKHWEVFPLFYLYHENKNKNIGNMNSNLLSLSYGNIIKKDIETTFGLLPESFENYQIVKSGDIILRLTDLQNDKRSLRTGLVSEEGIITSAYIGLRNTKKVINKYMHYLLHCYDLKKVFYSMGSGLRQSLNFSDIRRIPLLLPPYEEQRSIVDKLKVKQSEIDKTKENIQKQIEKLKEYRKILIHEAVTGKVKIEGGAK